MPTDAYTIPLAWRWTQASHNVLPPEVMAQIVPVPHAPMPSGITARGELDPSSFSEIQIASANIPCEEGTKWLHRLPVALSELVTVEWAPSTVIQTTWEIFTRFWDDFCYPVSDDVEIFPQSGEWLLLYHHWEVFEWGRRLL
jgi:hypothetical protein